MTVPSGIFDGKGLGEAEESKHTRQSSRAQRGDDVGTAVWDLTPVAVRLVRRWTVSPALEARPKACVIRGFLCTDWPFPVGEGQEHVSGSPEVSCLTVVFPGEVRPLSVSSAPQVCPDVWVRPALPGPSIWALFPVNLGKGPAAQLAGRAKRTTCMGAPSTFRFVCVYTQMHGLESSLESMAISLVVGSPLE